MSGIRYFDAHCHVQFAQYDTDREEVIAQMQAQGVAGLVVGCDLDSSRKAVALAERYEHLWAAIGLHPNHESDEWYDAALYRELAKSAKVVAVGECGLDYYRPHVLNDDVKAKQKAILNDQIELAAELDRPLIVHARPAKGTQDAYQDVTQLLKDAKEKYPNLRGDIHFFVGGAAEAKALIDLGFTISYTAVITFARDYDDTIRSLPLSSILSETDAPYVAPAARRGQRNDPLAVQDVARQIAAIRGEDPETVRKALLVNAGRLLGLDL